VEQLRVSRLACLDGGGDHLPEPDLLLLCAAAGLAVRFRHRPDVVVVGHDQAEHGLFVVVGLDVVLRCAVQCP